ncbi:SnoaL-like domain-containing protein [Carboxydocella sporoproducens DSM 16521]|uniref:SnoaL-like domain-containing protein n=2 Tax=Carboxydocella TaxID=178898 RepID=A0A1T4NEV1_9FIRM|nr:MULTISPECIES: nuclear transport factor 2 family protein [Carboxydocella]AVX20015.1 SnoaL-like domain-containing protein [Carboxydocella thermautotrophica]AVX30431.1 SnoaL-like domain-containing protein [Carboxydocella thermautotrophica]SJZ77871.1 SnoaL-like domain-containing protein [Carboxydocella sporoproducens DSM 16521]
MQVTKKSLFISTLIVLSALVIIWGGLGFVDKNTADDQAEIRQTILKSVELSQSLPVLPEPQASTPQEKIPDQVKRIMYDKITSSLMEIYSSKSPLLIQRISALQQAVDKQELEKFRARGGGYSKVENVQITINGDSATAQADITTWSEFIEANGKKFRPENGGHYVFSLVKENGKWKITGEEFSFLPGQEP